MQKKLLIPILVVLVIVIVLIREAVGRKIQSRKPDRKNRRIRWLIHLTMRALRGMMSARSSAR